MMLWNGPGSGRTARQFCAWSDGYFTGQEQPFLPGFRFAGNLAPSVPTAITFFITATEAFLVPAVAISVMVRMVRVEGFVILGILPASVQAIEIPLLPVIPAGVHRMSSNPRLCRRWRQHPTAEQKRKYQTGSCNQFPHPV